MVPRDPGRHDKASHPNRGAVTVVIISSIFPRFFWHMAEWFAPCGPRRYAILLSGLTLWAVDSLTVLTEREWKLPGTDAAVYVSFKLGAALGVCGRVSYIVTLTPVRVALHNSPMSSMLVTYSREPCSQKNTKLSTWTELSGDTCRTVRLGGASTGWMLSGPRLWSQTEEGKGSRISGSTAVSLIFRQPVARLDIARWSEELWRQQRSINIIIKLDITLDFISIRPWPQISRVQERPPLYSPPPTTSSLLTAGEKPVAAWQLCRSLWVSTSIAHSVLCSSDSASHAPFSVFCQCKPSRIFNGFQMTCMHTRHW